MGSKAILRKRIGSNYAQGAAYIFVKPTNGWPNLTPAAILASDGAAGDWLGYAVAISGDQIVMGRRLPPLVPTPRQGAAYTFVRPSTGWKTTSQFSGKVGASNGEKGNEFGWSVSVGGDMLLVGAPAATSLQGAAYLLGP